MRKYYFMVEKKKQDECDTKMVDDINTKGYLREKMLFLTVKDLRHAMSRWAADFSDDKPLYIYTVCVSAKPKSIRSISNQPRCYLHEEKVDGVQVISISRAGKTFSSVSIWGLLGSIEDEKVIWQCQPSKEKTKSLTSAGGVFTNKSKDSPSESQGEEKSTQLNTFGV